MEEKISEVMETVLAAIITGFGGFIFVKDILLKEEEENETK